MKRFPFLCALLFVACSQNPKTPAVQAGPEKNNPIAVGAPDETNITCWGIGPFEFGDDFTAVEEKAGKQNLSTDSLFLEGDFDRLVTKIWKGSSKEITIIWAETKAPFKTIKTFEISQPNSPYKFNNGIRIGSSIKEIVKLNGGEPINLFGFGWNYGGTFIDFGKGKLKGDLPCFGGVFELKTEKAGAEVEQVMGDQQINSSSAAFTKYLAVLKIIRISEKP